ncbi:cytochrome P450 [Mycobacterium sp. OTB74]|nr:cytochrome P450 [Mycobacterium sp. OTB74]
MSTDVDLPVIPAPRAVQCPLHPPPEFARWRDEPGLRKVLYHGVPTWLVSRYHDIRAALVDPRLSAETFPDALKPESTDDTTPIMFARSDDPEHNRIRRMMTSDFTFRRCEAMRPHIQAIVDRFIGDMIAKGSPADLVHDFGLPVPSLVIALLLGVPEQDLGPFQQYTSAGLVAHATDEQKAQAFGSMYAYIEQLVDIKAREPGDDLISRLVVEQMNTGQINRATVVLSGITMLVAGHETTANMISLGTVALLENPAVFARLGETEDAAEIAQIVEEMMRYLSIVHCQVDRVATEDLELGGQQIRAGDHLLMNIPAGNWDAGFTENPEVFDVNRNTRGHVGFGYGAHNCIGANLARVEMQVAFATLARRLPSLRLAGPTDKLKFKGTSDIYGMEELPVAW